MSRSVRIEGWWPVMSRRFTCLRRSARGRPPRGTPMTTTPSRTPTTAEGAAAGTGTARLFAGIAAPLGPVLFALATLVVPYSTNGSSKEIAADIAAHQGTTEVSVWLWTVGTVMFLPGLVGIGLSATARSARLGLW